MLFNLFGVQLLKHTETPKVACLIYQFQLFAGPTFLCYTGVLYMCVCVCIFVRTVAAALAENVIYDGRPIVCSFILCYVYTNHIKRWWMSVFRIAPVTFWCITRENCRCIILSTDSVKYTCHGCVSVAGSRTGSNKWSRFEFWLVSRF